MELEFRSKGVLMTEGLRSHVERRLRFALGRFVHRVRRVCVNMTVTGPKEGDDIQCLLQASLTPTGTLRISETHRDAFSAVTLAGDAFSRHLSRHLRRIHRRRKGR